MFLNKQPFDDFWWDTAPSNERMKYSIVEQAVPSVLFAKETVPFYREHYRKISLQDIQRISTADEFLEVIPTLTKEHLTLNNPEAFIPEGIERDVDANRGTFFRFGTGGTTGKSVLVSHSIEDWRAMSLTGRRSIEYDFWRDPYYIEKFGESAGKIHVSELTARRTPLHGVRVVGSYNGDHITNPIYANFLQALGVTFYFRPSTNASVDDILHHISNVRANGILAPPEGENRQKGVFIRDIMMLESLKADQQQWRLSKRYNDGFQFVFWSSMPITEALYRHLVEDRRIPYIKGHYGSTEVAPTGSTCSQNQRSFHLDFGHSLLLLKKINGHGVAASGELGYTLVSKIAGVQRDGTIIPPTGSVIINYMTGDAARLKESPKRCQCGRTTPVLYDFQRIEFNQGKAVFGCQIN